MKNSDFYTSTRMGPRQKQTAPAFSFPPRFNALSHATEKLYYIPSPQVIAKGQIITIPNFFSNDLCNDLIASFEKNLSMETTPLIKSKDYAARVNDRALVNDFDASATLYKYLLGILLQTPDYPDEDSNHVRNEFKDASGLNPQLRMYRYRKGHHFGKHYDGSVLCATHKSGSARGKTKWTLLIYLTGGSDFAGGGTIFYNHKRGHGPLNIHPTKGLALLHKHGDDCLAHEAELVTSGEKWVLRSDVVFPLV